MVTPPDNYGLASVQSNSNISNNIISADFTTNRYETASEDFYRRYNNKMKLKKMRQNTNSARAFANNKNSRKHENKNSRKNPIRNRPISLEFSKKPRKITYKPYTMSDYECLAPVNIGSGKLGPDLEDVKFLIELPEEQQRYDIVTQVNDMMEEGGGVQ